MPFWCLFLCNLITSGNCWDRLLSPQYSKISVTFFGMWIISLFIFATFSVYSLNLKIWILQFWEFFMLFLRWFPSLGFSVLWGSPTVSLPWALLDCSSNFLISFLLSTLSLFSLHSSFCLFVLSLWCLLLSLNVYFPWVTFQGVCETLMGYVGEQVGARWPVSLTVRWSDPHQSFTWDPQVSLCQEAFPLRSPHWRN